MAEKYVVFVAAPQEGEAEALADRLAELLRLKPAQVSALMRRLPAVVTRPVSEREATMALTRFQRAGFDAELRTESGVPVAPAAEERPAAPSTPEAASDEAAGEAGFSSAAPLDAPALGAEQRTEASLRPMLRPTFESLDEEPLVSDSTTSASSAAAEPDATRGAAVQATVTRAATAEPERATRPAAPPARADRKRRRGTLSAKLLSTAIIPVLLTTIGALAVTWLTARPALYDQLLESARNPAIATAATLSSTLERSGGDEIDHLQLLETILITRQAFARQNLSFILATDNFGNPYSGSFLGGSSFPEQSLELQNAVRERAVHAVEEAGAGRTAWAEGGATSHVEAAGGQRIEIVAQPLLAGNAPIGAVVVGVTDETVTRQVNSIVINVLLFSLIPLLLAIIIAAVRARRLTSNVLHLTRRADEISRGDLDEPVVIRSNDELDDLSAALERMRVSMSGALERLRRRR